MNMCIPLMKRELPFGRIFITMGYMKDGESTYIRKSSNVFILLY